MEWADVFQRIEQYDGEIPTIFLDLLRFNRTLSSTSEFVLVEAAPAHEDETAVHVARALETGNAEALARFAAREHTNGTPYPSTPPMLYTGVQPLLNLLDSGKPDSVSARRYLCGQAILMALPGVAGVSLRSLFGLPGVLPDTEQLLNEVADEASLRYRVTSRYLGLIEMRRSHAAFQPTGQKIILDLNPGVFALERISPDGQERVVALHNVTEQVAAVEFSTGGVRRWRNLQIDEPVDIPAVFTYRIVLSPYQVAWLRAE